jgi:hypothetical protein
MYLLEQGAKQHQVGSGASSAMYSPRRCICRVACSNDCHLNNEASLSATEHGVESATLRANSAGGCKKDLYKKYLLMDDASNCGQNFILLPFIRQLAASPYDALVYWVSARLLPVIKSLLSTHLTIMHCSIVSFL